MKRKVIAALGVLLLSCTLFTGCGEKDSEGQEPAAAMEAEDNADEETQDNTDEEAQDNADEETEDNADEQAVEKSASELPDGVYSAEFHTDSSMFHVSEACDGKGTLTVENGEMTIHISLGSKKILNLYPGLAEDAAKEGAELLVPTVDTVTYDDGMTEEVYGFDVPVPALNKEFDLALIGTKEKWYDHKVSVSNPVPLEDAGSSENTGASKSTALPEDGVYSIELAFEGGSGKAEILSPATITVKGEEMTATVEWSSPNYDYMIVDGETYLPVNTDGNSVFKIPVLVLDEPMAVIGDTVAMSKPHEVEYILTFHSDTMKAAE